MSRRANSSQSVTRARRSSPPDARRQAALAIGASLDPHQVLTAIAQQACALTACRSSAVYLLDAKSNVLQFVMGHHWPDAWGSAATTPGHGTVGRAFRRRQTLIADEQNHTVAAVSLVAGSDRWGVLQVARGRKGPRFNARDMAALEWFAPLAAQAIANSRAFLLSIQTISQLQISNEMLRTVGNIARAIIDLGYDLDRLLVEVLEQTLTVLDLRGGAVQLYDENTGQFATVVERDWPDAARVHSIQRGKMLIEPLDKSQDAGTLVSLPLVVGGRVIGVMQVVTMPGQALRPADRDALAIVASQLAVGIENARIFQQVGAEEQRLRAILSNTDNVVLSVDSEGRLTMVNAAAERVLGFSADAGVGQRLDQATSNEALRLALDQAQRDTRPFTFQVPLSDERVLFACLSPILTSEGAAEAWVIVMQDITQMKKIEKLQADMLLKASHELRNPINLILGALEFLELHLDTPNPAQREALDLAKLGVDQADALIKDLLDLERLERGMGLQMGRCDCAQLLRAVGPEFDAQALRQAVSFEMRVSEGPLLVWGDDRLLSRAVGNLVENALQCVSSNGSVTVEARAEEGQVVLLVSDTGPGIPTEMQSHVFERFYRPPHQPGRGKGTGLELTIVKSIVEQHNGRVWVTSQPGRGSTFTVSLPALDKAAG